MSKTIIIADDNQELVTSLKAFVEKDERYSVVATANNGEDVISLVEKYRPDFLLLEIVLPKLDGFGVLNSLTGKHPTVIMTSQLATDGFVQKALQCGATYFMAKPVNFLSLLKALDEITAISGNRAERTRTQSTAPANNRNLDEKLANLFISVGIPAHIKGYQYLREAVKITIDNPDMIGCLTKKLYPAIAGRFSTSPSRVERAIRHAIEVSWNRGKIENINNIFGMKVYDQYEKPTNGELIALIADKMLFEGA